MATQFDRTAESSARIEATPDYTPAEARAFLDRVDADLAMMRQLIAHWQATPPREGRDDWEPDWRLMAALVKMRDEVAGFVDVIERAAGNVR